MSEGDEEKERMRELLSETAIERRERERGRNNIRRERREEEDSERGREMRIQSNQKSRDQQQILGISSRSKLGVTRSPDLSILTWAVALTLNCPWSVRRCVLCLQLTKSKCK